MKKLIAIAVLCAASGCAATQDTTPEAPIRFAESNYTLGSEVTAEACRIYVFNIAWSALFGRDTSWTSGGSIIDLLVGSRTTPEAEEAMFTALESEAGATHLVAPRVRNSFQGLGTVGVPFIGKRCGTVWARTATVGEPIANGGAVQTQSAPAPQTPPPVPASTPTEERTGAIR